MPKYYLIHLYIVLIDKSQTKYTQFHKLKVGNQKVIKFKNRHRKLRVGPKIAARIAFCAQTLHSADYATGQVQTLFNII